MLSQYHIGNKHFYFHIFRYLLHLYFHGWGNLAFTYTVILRDLNKIQEAGPATSTSPIHSEKDASCRTSSGLVDHWGHTVVISQLCQTSLETLAFPSNILPRLSHLSHFHRENTSTKPSGKKSG